MMLLGAATLTAQRNDAADPLKALQAYSEALGKCDRSAVDKLTTDDALTIGPRGNVVTKQEVLEQMRQCKPNPPATMSDTRARIYGNDTAVVTGRAVLRGRGGQDAPEQRFTAVLVKTVDGWKYASYHAATIRTTDTPAK